MKHVVPNDLVLGPFWFNLCVHEKLYTVWFPR